MHLVKRYTNRKLYDTEERKYVSLHDVADLVRAGKEVRVLDHQSGEDLTATTLSRILQREKMGLPLLQSLIRMGGDAWLRASSMLDEGRLEGLIKRGEVALGDLQRLGEGLAGGAVHSRKLESMLLAEAEAILERWEMPSREDLQRLETQLEELSEKLDILLNNPSEEKPEASRKRDR